MPAEETALGDVPVVLAVGNWECGHFATLADTKEDCEQVEGPGVLDEENNQQREDLQGHTHDPDRSATHPFRHHGHNPPGDDSGSLLGSKYSRGHSQRQPPVHRNGDQEDVDNVVAHAPPVVDADQVPEGYGAFCLLDEHPGSYLGNFVIPRPLDSALNRPVSGIAQGTQPYVGWSAVKELDEQEKQRPAGYSGEPEDPLHSQLAEGRANQKEEYYYP